MKWVELQQATDCASCSYTIRADDAEGMLLADGQYFCMEACYAAWIEDPTARTRQGGPTG